MSGTDEMWLRAYNGTWSSGPQANITDPGTPPPVVMAHNQTVATGQQVALSDIFSVTGSGITQYQLWFSWPEAGAPAVGTGTNNGTARATEPLGADYRPKADAFTCLGNNSNHHMRLLSFNRP